MNKIIVRSGALLLAVLFFCGIVAMAAPVNAVNATDTYTVSGVWVFNDVVDIDSNRYDVSINFTCPDCSDPDLVFTSFIFGGNYITITYVSDSGSSISSSGVYSSTKGWNDGYQKVYFGPDPISVDETFYNYLIANATFIPPPPEPGPLVEMVTDLKDRKILDLVTDPILMMIPIMLAFLVSYKGFSKALAILRRILQRS